MKYTEYPNFESLKKHEKGCYSRKLKVRHSTILIIAPHAGKIEPGTAKIARKIAGDNFSLYRFVGHRRKFKKDPGEGRMQSLHLPSARFNEPKAVKFVKACEFALAVHGLKNAVADKFNGLDIYVGGRNRDAREKVVACLKSAGFNVADCATAEYRDFPHKGHEPKNIVNKCNGEGGGVQLEITRRERKALVHDNKRMKLLCEAIRKALDFT